jgi:hypothetical protein
MSLGDRIREIQALAAGHVPPLSIYLECGDQAVVVTGSGDAAYLELYDTTPEARTRRLASIHQAWGEWLARKLKGLNVGD